MTAGILLTLGILALVLILLGVFAKLWLSSTGGVSQHVRVELEKQQAERQIQHIAYAAMARMMDEVRREQR